MKAYLLESARRPPPAHRGDTVARQGNGHGCIARRAARDDAEARALLGDGLRLAQVRGEAERPAAVHHRKIDGLDIHFIHVRSKHENALPVIVTHGWPGSIIEQMKIIDPLTNPTAMAGAAEDSFDVVIPSLPGYGFSGKPTAPGWTPSASRQSVGDADATPRLHTVRGAGRRLGQCRLGGDGPAAAAGIARHSHQHGGHGSTRCFKGAFGWRPAARRPLGRGKTCVGPTR
jgi:pimeloyl-ACP methyl ester carboxylesterase